LSAVARFRLLLGNSYWRVSTLMVASVVAGLIEAAILAAVAQAAAALVDGARRVDTAIGPLHVNESITAMLRRHLRPRRRPACPAGPAFHSAGANRYQRRG